MQDRIVDWKSRKAIYKKNKIEEQQSCEGADVTKSRLAIIGGGPKACAIAAKVAILSEAEYKHPAITVFEPVGAGAHWSGGSGFTDGFQELCTSALRDVGFPYNDPVTNELDEKMLAYSWPSYLISRENDMSYSDWVSSDSPRPSHSLFAEYLQWCLERAKASSSVEVEEASVTEIDFDFEKQEWIVTSSDENENSKSLRFNGVVVTGIKERDSGLIAGEKGPFYFNGKSYWEEEGYSALADLYERRKDSHEEDLDLSGVVIGDGGTAAAITLSLSERFADADLQMIGSGVFLQSRPPNFFSDRIFGNRDDWEELSDAQREAFSARLSSGAIWQPIVDRLTKASRFKYHIGRAEKIEWYEEVVSRDRVPDFKYSIKLEKDSSTEPEDVSEEIETFTADFVVDATGFEVFWFKELLSSNLKEFLNWNDRSTLSKLRADLSDGLDIVYTNSEGQAFPTGLVVPMIGDLRHPAAPNLMALGSVADKILQRFRRP